MKTNKSLTILLAVIAIAGVAMLFAGTFLQEQEKELSVEKQRKKTEEELVCFLENTPGVGKTTVRLCIDENGKITGAAVVCAGGNSPEVKAEVIQLLSTALGVGTNKIYVAGG